MDEEVLMVIRRWIEKAEHDLTTASVGLAEEALAFVKLRLAEEGAL